ncbi:MAG: ATP-binding protein [Anaerohalosphaeraceae bacterium]
MAKRQALLWQIYPAVLILLLCFLAALYWTLSTVLQKNFLEEKKEELRIRAVFVQSQIAAAVKEPFDPPAIDQLCKTLGRQTATRITVITLDGKVLGESDKDPSLMDNHLSRPEIQQALGGHVGYDIRPSTTLGERFLYVAVPYPAENPSLFIRTAASVKQMDEILGQIRRQMMLSAVPAGVFLALLLWLICWRLTRPLKEMEAAARRLAEGDVSVRMPPARTREFASLAKSMNKMAQELIQRLDTITAQRNEQQAVLTSMSEGVLAMDLQNRCISINNAACKLLQITVPDPVGRTLPEIIRNTQFHDFVQKALVSAESLEEHLLFREPDQSRSIQARSSVLMDREGNRIGTLIVLNDITDVYKAQRVKSDFVANVSHELKTPVTSIKGFIETLLDGAKDNPEDLHRFLEIMRRQTERLNSIIEDLLTLSAIEQQTQESAITRQTVSLKTVLKEAVECCLHQANQKQISLQINCPDNLTAFVNSSLLIQALVNLIDNAIKYSETGQSILLQASREGPSIRIDVKDSGCGIAKEHLPRLFERFYRADKARSRALGGTGLGLAIVKHIVLAHNGTVQVDSTVGKGSTFSIFLPAENS